MSELEPFDTPERPRACQQPKGTNGTKRDAVATRLPGVCSVVPADLETATGGEAQANVGARQQAQIMGDAEQPREGTALQEQKGRVQSRGGGVEHGPCVRRLGTGEAGAWQLRREIA